MIDYEHIMKHLPPMIAIGYGAVWVKSFADLTNGWDNEKEVAGILNDMFNIGFCLFRWTGLHGTTPSRFRILKWCPLTGATLEDNVDFEGYFDKIMKNQESYIKENLKCHHAPY